MVYPPECVSKSDEYHYEIRLAKLRFVKCAALPVLCSLPPTRQLSRADAPPSRASSRSRR